MMNRLASFTVLVAIALAWPDSVGAQTVDRWTEIQQLQADLKADRQAVVATNLPLTEAEARAFWPVYKEYRGEVERLGDRLATLITAYAASFGTITDEKADTFFKELLAIERDKVTVREKYRTESPSCAACHQDSAFPSDREQTRRDRQHGAGLGDPAGAPRRNVDDHWTVGAIMRGRMSCWPPLEAQQRVFWRLHSKSTSTGTTR